MSSTSTTAMYLLGLAVVMNYLQPANPAYFAGAAGVTLSGIALLEYIIDEIVVPMLGDGNE